MLSVMMHRSEKNTASERSFLGRWDTGGVVSLYWGSDRSCHPHSWSVEKFWVWSVSYLPGSPGLGVWKP